MLLIESRLAKFFGYLGLNARTFGIFLPIITLGSEFQIFLCFRIFWLEFEILEGYYLTEWGILIFYAFERKFAIFLEVYKMNLLRSYPSRMESSSLNSKIAFPSVIETMINYLATYSTPKKMDQPTLLCVPILLFRSKPQMANLLRNTRMKEKCTM